MNQEIQPSFNWEPLIHSALDPSLTYSNLAFPVNFPTPPYELISTKTAQNSYYPTPPWKRDDWVSGLTGKGIDKLHQTLRHPEPTSLLQLFRQQSEQRKIPKSLRNKIQQHSCQDCDEHPQLPRVPKISIPAPASPNLTVTLDVMQHTIHDKPVKILVMLDAGDMMIRLKRIANDSACTVFSAYFTR